MISYETKFGNGYIICDQFVVVERAKNVGIF